MLEEWASHARNFSDFFGRWRSPFSNLRSIWNSCIPVAVVDRFRDDEEGSLYGCTCSSVGAINEYTAAVLFNPEHDIEVHAITCWQGFTYLTFWPSFMMAGFHIFTPIIPYNPIQNNLAGAFRGGLLTNRAFTFPTSLGFTGTNPALPPIWGEWHKSGPAVYDSLRNTYFDSGNCVYFDPPIRLYRGRSLCVQTTRASVSYPVEVNISFRWTERPRTTPGP